MQPVQFFLFGLLVAWLTGTGKLRALVNALKNDPGSGSTDNAPSQGNRIVPNPPEGPLTTD